MRKRLGIVLGGIAALAILGMIGSMVWGDPHVSQGRKLYLYYCASCHGVHGRPGEGYNWNNMPDPKPKDLSNKDEMGTLTDKELFETVSRDMKDTTPEVGDKIGEEEFAVPTMPTFKYTLSEKELWSLVAYVRTLHGTKLENAKLDWVSLNKERPKFESVPKPTLAASRAESARLAERGKGLYLNKYGCNGCHRIGNDGGNVGPALDRAGFRLNPQWVYRWIKYPQTMKPQTRMPNLGVSDDDAKAIMFYLRTLNAPPPDKPLPASS